MKELANAMGGLGCLVVATWLYANGYHDGWVVTLGIIGAIQALT